MLAHLNSHREWVKKIEELKNNRYRRTIEKVSLSILKIREKKE
jgi:hypothetical protein